MDLIPVSQLDTGVETEPVSHRELFKEIRTVSKLDYSEPQVAYLTARVAGRVDHLDVDFVGTPVKEGDHLVNIYSPELYSAQAELVRAVEAYEKAQGDRQFERATLEAARTKLQLLGILPQQLKELEDTRKVSTHLTLYAPIGGVVIEKNVREQQYVKEGDMLYQIANLDPIWLYLDIYEYDLDWVRIGQSVDVTVEAYPGETFQGRVVFIDPFLDDKTRTVKVRVNLKNPEPYRLKAAMYASAVIHVPLRSDGMPAPTGLERKYICRMHPEVIQDAPGRCPRCKMPLEQVRDVFPTRPIVPKSPPDKPAAKPTVGVLAILKSAVLDTGRRRIAYRKQKDEEKAKTDAYELVVLKLGPLADGKDSAGNVIQYYPVLGGLEPGDEVVVRGGFLLDSQRQIEGKPSLLYAEGRSAASLHAGHAMPDKPTKPSAGEHKH
jgi:Cu(I)/Ag(I) efflux system membrane fusion protein